MTRRPIALVALVSVLFAASPAAATYETLKRSLGNIIFGPVDVALSPVVATNTIYNNLRDVDDTLGVRVAYVPMGVAWNTMVQGMAGVTRCISGLIEFVPGLLVLPLDADLDPIFAPPERGNALMDYETPVIRLKLGVDYTTVPF
ncbi:MAG: hypothetical protein ACQGVC_04635 [Myxococcota bacterium]